MDSKYLFINCKPILNEIKYSTNGFKVKHKLQNLFEDNDVNFIKKSRNSEIKLNVVQKEINYTSEQILEQRQHLPIYHCKQRFIEEICKSDTILLMGETGSGKTTQIPQFLYDSGYANNGIIAITQPRRVAAITIAKRVSQEMSCKLGETVGFTVRFEDCTSKTTRVRFITDGSLLRESISDRLLKNYSVIVLDEVHERSVSTDVLLGIVKNAQKSRKLCNMPLLKIIVMSATMDIDNFGKYFDVKGMYLEGRTYPVRIMHTKEPQNDYVHSCLVTLFYIHRKAPVNHDVLIFLTGQEEIESVTQQIKQTIQKNHLVASQIIVYPLYSQLPQNKQLECFRKSPSNVRKVIVATNIAETSITIPGIRYVIDSGFVKRKIYNPRSGIGSLKIVRISQAHSWQRCGRAGRESNGFCYRLYTQKEMENFEKMPKPEILRSNISSVVLQLLSMGIDSRKFEFLDKPSCESIDSAYEELHFLGAIKSTNNPELTKVGLQMSQFPLDPRYSKLILTASQFGCVDEILNIVAILASENIYVSSTEKRAQSILAHSKFESKYGDHLTLLNIYNSFIKADKLKLWCHDNFFNCRNLLYARDIRNQLQEICERQGIINNIKNTEKENFVFDQVRKCLLSGLYKNIAEYQQRDNCYLIISSRQKARIHPSSILCGKRKPKLILFTEIISTEQNFLKCITEIEYEWILNVLPNLPYINRIKIFNSNQPC